MKYEKLDAIPNAATKARLEFSCERMGSNEVAVTYELVLPLNEVDCRGTFDHKASKVRPKNFKHRWLSPDNCFRFCLGKTIIGTSNTNYPFTGFQSETFIDLPFRDGAHSGWDADKFEKIERYYTVQGAVYRLIPEIKA